MVIIETGGQTWIEVFDAPAASLAANSASSTTFPLGRSGICIAAQASLDLNATSVIAANMGISIINGVTSGHITPGTHITAVRLRRWNDNGVAQTIGGYGIVFMRKGGL